MLSMTQCHYLSKTIKMVNNYYIAGVASGLWFHLFKPFWPPTAELILQKQRSEATHNFFIAHKKIILITLLLYFITWLQRSASPSSKLSSISSSLNSSQISKINNTHLVLSLHNSAVVIKLSLVSQ